MPLTTTAGQLAVNEALPEDLQDHTRRLDKKGVLDLMQLVAEKHPEQYKDIAHRLSQVGQRTASATGGYSFDLRHLNQADAAVKARRDIEAKIQQIYSHPYATAQQKQDAMVKDLQERTKPLEEAIFNESLREGNPLAHQVAAVGRGNKTSLKSLRGMDLLYEDHKGRTIPIPVLHSYSQGLRPAEYYAGTFGARRGITDVKEATRDAGAFSKQLIQATHRLVVTKNDYDDELNREHLGLPVAVTDPDNEGALLARAIGGYKRNTVLNPKIISDLHSQGHERMLVRSPMVGGPKDGGVFGRDVGVREKSRVAPPGDYVGIAAAQAAGEPLAQAGLSSKHTGGVAGATAGGVSGFKLINQLVQVPKTFKGGATHAQVDGRVGRVEEAPQGGHYVNVEGQKHYVATGHDLHVKPGDEVEAGDVLSSGIPNPSEIVHHKGIGEGKRYFTEAFRQAYKDANVPVHRRNVELIARGLVDHVRMTDEHGAHIPGDVVPYSRLEHFYQPREGHDIRDVRAAHGMYLEKPVLHYSIGTKVRPSVQKELNNFGINQVVVHKDPPPFQPEMIRGMENIGADPDWQTRFLGSYQEKNLLRGVHRGDVSDEAGSSYVPSLMRGTGFGRTGPAPYDEPIKGLG